MKRNVTRVVSMLLVLVICFSMLPTKAFAWGKMTHIYTANAILADTQAYRATVDFENENDFAFEIPEEFRDAINSYPDAFRAGALGPDMYPDILTGQMYIHPADPNIDSGE